MDEKSKAFLSNVDLTERWGNSIHTVRKLRHEGTGPLGSKIGGLVRYPVAEVERWEQEQAEKAAAVLAAHQPKPDKAAGLAAHQPQKNGTE